MIELAVISVIVVGIGIFLISVYNELTKERILVQEGWSGIGTFLQQRNDVIPNLVEIVKGYAGHENKTLLDVVRARNESAMAKTPDESIQANALLSQAMLNFKSLTEQYPDLKANQNFLDLQNKLADIEEKINKSRRYYNGTVREYNQSISVFPKNLVSAIFGFRPATFFAEDEDSRTAPKISFS